MDTYLRKFIIPIFIFSVYHAFVCCGKVKRSLLDLGDMIAFTTGRPGLDFNKYGNFCGRGGAGPIMDQIDWCCNLHDKCYSAATKRKCHTYIQKYKWTIINNEIVCGTVKRCGRASCECDKNLANCLGRFRYFYKYPLATRSKFQNFIRRMGHLLTRNRF